MIFTKTQNLEEELKYVKITHSLSLGHCGMIEFPDVIFKSEEDLISVRRLDISHNDIKFIPSNIKLFSDLRELWASFNPISIFPREILHLKKLEVIDIRGTLISEIPTEIVDLPYLNEIDWRDTPLAGKLKEQLGIQVNNLKQLKEIFQNINSRNKAKSQLFKNLLEVQYIMDVDKAYLNDTLTILIENLSNEFDNLFDFISFCGRPGKFLPERIDDINTQTVKNAKKLFYEMKRDTDRKRLAADLEIKIRAIYFDRIERSEVIELIDSIYANVHLLEDVQFLIQYSKEIFPKNINDSNGQVVWKNILDLQDDLIVKRENSIKALANALSQIYPEQKPEHLIQTSRNIAKYFQLERFATKKELLRMTQLTADASKVFPPDFASINNEDIISNAKELIFKNL